MSRPRWPPVLPPLIRVLGASAALCAWGSVPWQSSRGWDRELQQRAQPAPSDGEEKQGGGTAAVGMLPIRKSPKPLCANGNTPCS